MSISQATDIPTILTENRELFIFVPPVSFGYLHILTNDVNFLFTAMYLMATATVLSYEITTEVGPRGEDDSGWINSILVPMFLLLIITPTILSFPAAIHFLFSNLSILEGIIRTTEIVSVALLLINVGYLSLFCLCPIFFPIEDLSEPFREKDHSGK